MVMRPEFMQEDYEPLRLSRFKCVKQCPYTPLELKEAHDAWAKTHPSREVQWDFYCDVRDWVPKGTNAKIRQERAMRH